MFMVIFVVFFLGTKACYAQPYWDYRSTVTYVNWRDPRYESRELCLV